MNIGKEIHNLRTLKHVQIILLVHYEIVKIGHLINGGVSNNLLLSSLPCTSLSK